MKKIRVSNSLDLDQADILSGLVWVQTICKGYQQTKRVKCDTPNPKIFKIANTFSKEKLMIFFFKINFH